MNLRHLPAAFAAALLFATGALAQTSAILRDPTNSGPFGTTTRPFRVDPTGGTTQPVSAASLPLPAGAATAANQTATQGTFGAVVGNRSVLYSVGGSPIDLTVPSGILGADGTTLASPANPLPTSAGTVAQGSTTSGQSGQLIQCAVITAAPSYTTAQTSPLNCTTNGILRVGLFNPTGTAISFAAPTNDSSAVLTGLATWSQNGIFDGTDWDRQRAIAGTFGSAAGVAAVEQVGSTFAYISTATTTQVKSGAGILHKIVINTPVAGTISLIDNTSGSTVNMGVITMTADLKPYALEYNLGFATGLRIITSVAADITVVYR